MWTDVHFSFDIGSGAAIDRRGAEACGHAGRAMDTPALSINPLDDAPGGLPGGRSNTAACEQRHHRVAPRPEEIAR